MKWKISAAESPVYGSDGTLVDERKLIYDVDTMFPVALVCGLRQKNTRNNALLVAAAPQMLDLLRDISLALECGGLKKQKQWKRAIDQIVDRFPISSLSEGDNAD